MGIPMGIPTGFLWEWDGNGNGNSIPTATVHITLNRCSSHSFLSAEASVGKENIDT